MPESSHTTREPSFDEFPIPTYKEWYDTVVASLKGGSFEKKLLTTTYEDIDIHPMYFQEDIANLSHPHTLPGQPPYVRGNHANSGWLIAQEIPYGSPQTFNEALKADLQNGQTTINLVLDTATRHGIDPINADKEIVGCDGVSIASLADLEAALDGIDLRQYPLMVNAGTAATSFFVLLQAYCHKHDYSLDQLRVSLAYDPLSILTTDGNLSKSLSEHYDDMAELIRWTSNLPYFKMIGIHSAPYSEGGANTVQEIAFALATGIEYIHELLQRRLLLETIVSRIQFNFTLGAQFFTQIAKLRATRMLWAQIIAGFGGSDEIATMRIHTSTLKSNKTMLDPYVNMLRTTTEALSGALGGAESMQVSPFDTAIAPPTEFSRRIARNQQLILQHETHITNTIDAAGGSWYIEYLTDQIAQKSWTLLQEVESFGGMSKALIAGFPQEQIAKTAEKRVQHANTRKDRIVGTNAYANLQEKPIENETDYEALYEQRIQEYRSHTEIPPSADAAEVTLDGLKELVLLGATIEQLTQLLSSESASDPIQISAIPRLRVSEAFEQLRDNALAFKERNGNLPNILMVKFGNEATYKARIDFTKEFFTVGGFNVWEQTAYQSPDEAALNTLESGATTIVICATDDIYRSTVPDFAQIIKTTKPDIVLILAGYPEADVAAYQEAGIDVFIHLGADCVEINHKLQQRLGIAQ